MKRTLLVLPILLACSIVFLAPAAHAQCVDGTIEAQLETDGPFAGLWKYTLDITWDIPQGLSNVTLSCNFECAAICDAGWAFADTSGTGDGILDDENPMPGECTVPFGGEFNCQGNQPWAPEGPHVKWDAIDMGTGCEAGTTGSATLCFWVDLPPAENQPAPVVIIKNGQNVCEGTIMGDCPACPVGAEPLDWSQVKYKYIEKNVNER